MNKATLEPAFPTLGQGVETEGMTLRDYFAVHASESDIAFQGEEIRFNAMRKGRSGVLPDGWRTIARYMHADAMLKEREK